MKKIVYILSYIVCLINPYSIHGMNSPENTDSQKELHTIMIDLENNLDYSIRVTLLQEAHRLIEHNHNNSSHPPLLILLLYACSYNDSQLVQLLIDANVNINDYSIENSLVLNPVANAYRHNRSDIIHLLLNTKKIDLSLSIGKHNSPLLWHIIHENLLRVYYYKTHRSDTLKKQVPKINNFKILLNYVGDISLYTDKNGNSILHKLCKKWPNEYKVIAMIIPHIDVTAQNKKGKTALHLVCKYSDSNQQLFKALHLLLPHYKNINSLDNKNNTILHELMKPRCDSWSDSFLKAVELLIDYKIDINIKNKKGHTAIHNCTKAFSESIEMIAHNIPITQEDFTHQFYYPSKVIALFFNNQGNLHAKDNNGKTVLHYAAEDQHIESVAMLIVCGLNLNTTDKNNKKPIDYVMQDYTLYLPCMNISPINVTDIFSPEFPETNKGAIWIETCRKYLLQTQKTTQHPYAYVSRRNYDQKLLRIKK